MDVENANPRPGGTDSSSPAMSWVNPNPNPPPMGYPVYYGEPIILMELEKIVEKIEKETCEFREILHSPTTCITDPYFCFKGSYIIADMMYTARIECGGELIDDDELDEDQKTQVEKAKAQIVTAEDWRKAEIPWVLMFIINMKLWYLEIITSSDPYSVSEKKEEKDVPSSKEEQYRQFLYRLLDDAQNLRLQVISMAPNVIEYEQTYYLLDLASRVTALLFFYELVVKSSSICDTVEDMKRWVKKQIAKMDLSLSPDVTYPNKRPRLMGCLIDWKHQHVISLTSVGPNVRLVSFQLCWT